jgi:hypothetical protein
VDAVGDELLAGAQHLDRAGTWKPENGCTARYTKKALRSPTDAHGRCVAEHRRLASASISMRD